MTFINGLKRLCDICFYMAFASIIGGLFGAENLIATLPFFATTAFLGVYLAPHGKKQYFSILPLALTFWITSFDLVSAITITPAIIYTITSLPKKDEHAATFEYEAPFKLFIVVYGWILAFVIIMDTLPGDTSLPTDSYLFALTYILNAIIFTRMIRHDAEVYKQTRFKLLNAIPMVGIIGVAILLSTDFFGTILARTWGFIWTNLLLPALEFIVLIIRIPFVLIMRLFNFDATMAPMAPPPEMITTDESPFEFIPADDESWLGGLLAFVLVVAVVIGIYLLFKYLMNQKMTFIKTDDDIEEIRTAINQESRIRNPFNRDKLNPIRKIYREFLQMVAKTGVEVPNHFTSADIEQIISHKYECVATEQLRAEYIKFRYQETDFDKADVERLKMLQKKIKQEIHEKRGG